MPTLDHPLRSPSAGPDVGRRTAFTLVEMMVVITVIGLLASLTLMGLAGTRQRAKADKTRSTIRKLSEIVVPHYEGYLRRRLPVSLTTSGTQNARERLVAIRRLMLYEMPDSWGDVSSGTSTATPPLSLISTFSYLRTGPIQAFSAYRVARPGLTATFADAECLSMLVSLGTREPDVMEQFRADEIGDADKDTAPEFIDGWQTPIGFIRWAPGASSPLASGTNALSINSPIQIADPVGFHDPCDPMNVDAPLSMSGTLTGFALTPLIYSCGPDLTAGLVRTGTGGWLTYASGTITSGTDAPDGRVNLASTTFTVSSPVSIIGTRLGTVGTPLITGSNVIGMRDRRLITLPFPMVDNITNHDLIKK